MTCNGQLTYGVHEDQHLHGVAAAHDCLRLLSSIAKVFYGWPP